MTIDSDWPHEMAMLNALSGAFQIYAFGDLLIPQHLGAVRHTMFVADVVIVRAPDDLVAYRMVCTLDDDPWHPDTVLWHACGPMATVLARMMSLCLTDGALAATPYRPPECCRLPLIEMVRLDRES